MDYKSEEYVNRLMTKQPKVDRKYPKSKPEKIYRMLQVTDAHVDRTYLEGSNAECTQAS
jgi:hypothetical protein